MPRPVRVHLTEALYYVTCKAAEGFHLFKDSIDYETYVGFLNNYREQFGFKLFAYCLLRDEVHLLMELTDGTTVSEVMHALNSRYTKHIIKRYEHMGHVFQERFRSTLIEKTPASLLELTAVVHRLPKDIGVTADWQAYRWSWASSQPENSVKESVFSYWRAELAHPVVGSEEFHRLVQEKARLIKEGKAAQAAVLVQAPSSTASVTRAVLPVFAGSAAVALLSLGIVVGALKHQAHLQQTVQMLGRQVQSSVSQIANMNGSESSATLATYGMIANLAGTAWDIQVTDMDRVGAKSIQEDVLEFNTGKVASKQLIGQGFTPMNYSLTLQPDGTARWETMITGKTGEIVCLQGEVAGQQMHGVMTRQFPGQATANFSFVGVIKPVQQAAHQFMREA